MGRSVASALLGDISVVRPAALPTVHLPQKDTPDVEPAAAAVAHLDLVLHLRRKDRRVAAVAEPARAVAGKRHPTLIMRQRARGELLTDLLGGVRRRRHLDPVG